MFGERLKDLREENGLTQAEFAVIIGVTRVCVSSWELGKYGPSLDKFIDIANYFKVSADFLLGNSHGKSVIDVTRLNNDDMQVIYGLVNYFKSKSGIRNDRQENVGL